MRALTPPLPPAALRVMAVTSEDCGLRMCAPLNWVGDAAARIARAPVRIYAAYSTPAELQQWPYWPDYPGQPMRWR